MGRWYSSIKNIATLGAGVTLLLGLGNPAFAQVPTYSVITPDAVTGDNPTQSFTVPGVTCTLCYIPDPNGSVDVFTTDTYERPTGSGSGASAYFPALDIEFSRVGFDATWLYYRIDLYGQDTAVKPLPYFYAFEINLDNDNKGDLFVRSEDPSSKIGGTFGPTAGIIAFYDTNNNVGDGQPLLPDGPSNTLGGYETLVFDQGTNNAPGRTGQTTDIQARVVLVGTKPYLELAVRRVFLNALNGSAVTKAAFRPYAAKAGSTTAANTLYLHDEYGRLSGGSPFPRLSLTGAPATCPNTLATENALTPTQRNALDSGTNVIAATFANPCYPSGGNIVEMDNGGNLSTFALGNDIFFVSSPDLTITKTHVGNFTQGQTGATYTLTPRNSGTASTTGTVTVTDTLPAGLTATAATGTGWTCTLNTPAVGQVQCTSSTVIAASTNYPVITLTVSVASNAATPLANNVSAAGGGETNTGNNSASDSTIIVTAPDMTITKTHVGNFTQGQTGATYTLTARNSGTVATTSNVTVTDSLPAQIVPTAAAGTGWTCTITGQNVSCTRTTFTALATGSSYPAITITVSVANSIASPVTNTANITGGGEGNTTNNSANDPTIINTSAAPNPLSCDGNFYQIRVTTGSQLFRIDRNVNPYTQTQIGNITPSITLNALGYNKFDGFMYAIGTSTNRLYRIDQNGAVFLGLVSGLPAADYNTATFDSAGNFYVKQGTLNTTIYKINVSTPAATTITLNQSINLGDMAFHPTDGAIYGLRDATLYKIVLSEITGAVTTIGSTNISGSPAVGSVFFDASGTLYGYENGGTFYLINTTNGNATQVSTAPNTSQSDGASCPFTAPERVINTVKSVTTVSKVNSTTLNVPYTIVVTNTGTDTAPNTQITENLNLTFSTGTPTLTIPSGPIVTNGSCTANTSFNGTTDTKLLTGTNTLAVSGTCTIAFTVQVVYPNPASVPSTAQNNTAYGSSTLNSPNSGYTFISGTPIPPPALLSSSQSTIGVTYPATTNVPNLLLVKRITAINGVDVTGFQDGVNSPGNPNNVGAKAADDNAPFWPSPNTTSLRGAIHSSTIAPTVNLKPGDEVEYTVYFLNSGAASADNVSVCDFVPANQTFVSTGYDSSLVGADAGGLFGTNYGIIIQSNGATPVKATNVSDGDRGQFYNSSFPISCTGTTNGNGAVVVNMGSIPNATGSGTPLDSYGFIRFKAKIN